MTSLIKVSLSCHTVGLECLVNTNAVFWHDIPIVERMRHEDRSADRLHIMQIVATCPKIVVVTIGPIKIFQEHLVADLATAKLASRLISAMDIVE